MLRFKKVMWGNLKLGKNSRYQSNIKFLDVIFDKIWLKVNLILNRNFLPEGICHVKTEKGAKMLPLVQNKVNQFKILDSIEIQWKVDWKRLLIGQSFVLFANEKCDFMIIR